MVEQKVLRLGCTQEECIQRFRERAEQAFDAGDIEAALRFMQFVPQPDAAPDRPLTPPPSDMDFS